MNPTDLSSSSTSGPLRRNQACHQCRARKLKCDAGRPCSTCRRSHAKAIASLTAAGQSVLADPNCTYDYAPGEDPWTATLRSGLGLAPTPRNSSGSVSPANSANDVRVAHSSHYPSTSGHARRSPHYPPSSLAPSYPYAVAGSASPMLPGHRAHPSPSYPVAHLPGHHPSFPSGHPYPSQLPLDNLDYGEMADMLYNQMEMDPGDSLFPPRPSYTDPYFRALPAGADPLLYAHDPMMLPSGLPQFHSVSPLDLGADVELPEAYERGRGSSSSHSRSSRSRHRR
ncbi:hypothetical protein FRC08_000299 [Ceratobasidium sp. 394]|nr:hypothetical protein FRC08_000299 [Ceratobasidium sp. 394]KAG9084129.1 hypothetical protein FS749_005458 [Ceratobasidium sp. UAMH 11750]